jgi:CheY-like chemotaxis protein
MMGGTIAVRSEVGQGTSFQVDLPLPHLGEEVPAAARPESRSASASGATMAVKVLAAEDNTVNQLVLKTILHQVGADLTVVDDGEQAVEAWEREAWDVILMDVQMPVMDGPTAARRIRLREREIGRARTPIVALTANVMTHQTADYLAAGMDDCVAKPIQVAALLDVLAAVCAGPAGQG